MEAAGLISIISKRDVSSTVSRLVAAIKQSGLTMFGQRDFSKGMPNAQQLQPTVLVLFGNPNVIARLISANPQIGLDLPMRALVWPSSVSTANVSYNDPRWLISRHGLSEQFNELAKNMASVLDKVVAAACAE